MTKFIRVEREYIEDLEWLKNAAEDMLAEYLAGELGKPCRVLLKEDAVCRDECYTDCAARRLQTVLKKLEKKAPGHGCLAIDCVTCLDEKCSKGGIV